jgi:hypothetical protein
MKAARENLRRAEPSHCSGASSAIAGCWPSRRQRDRAYAAVALGRARGRREEVGLPFRAGFATTISVDELSGAVLAVRRYLRGGGESSN